MILFLLAHSPENPGHAGEVPPAPQVTREVEDRYAEACLAGADAACPVVRHSAKCREHETWLLTVSPSGSLTLHANGTMVTEDPIGAVNLHVLECGAGWADLVLAVQPQTPWWQVQEVLDELDTIPRIGVPG